MATLSYLEANKLIENLGKSKNRLVGELERRKIMDYSGRDPDLIKYFFNNPYVGHPAQNISIFGKFELKLLNQLFKNKDSVVSRDRIGETLWGINWYEKYSDWAIDSHISNIRKKISKDWKILTRRERGYMLTGVKNDLKISADEFTVSKETTKITQEYINYMNDPKKVRKTFKNLFEATRKYGINERIGNHEINNLLAINSFSIKNVEYL